MGRSIRDRKIARVSRFHKNILQKAECGASMLIKINTARFFNIELRRLIGHDAMISALA
jgi:hypothetical protein